VLRNTHSVPPVIQKLTSWLQNYHVYYTSNKQVRDVISVEIT
jgi:hypothetical protein